MKIQTKELPLNSPWQTKWGWQASYQKDCVNNRHVQRTQTVYKELCTLWIHFRTDIRLYGKGTLHITSNHYHGEVIF